MDKMQLPMKAFLFSVGIVLWAGIWLTGFDQTHWLLYVPASFLTFAAITGICPSLILFNAIFRVKQSQDVE